MPKKIKVKSVEWNVCVDRAGVRLDLREFEIAQDIHGAGLARPFRCSLSLHCHQGLSSAEEETFICRYFVIGARGFEPPTARPPAGCATRLRYAPFAGQYSPRSEEASARIAAHEKRYAAGVAFSALHWDLAGFQREVLRKQALDPKATAQSAFHFRWVMGCLDDAEGALRKAEGFSLERAAPMIEKPFLVVHGADDRVVPVASARKLFDAVGARDKQLKVFTAEEGGSSHALADNRPLAVRYIADWLGARL